MVGLILEAIEKCHPVRDVLDLFGSGKLYILDSDHNFTIGQKEKIGNTLFIVRKWNKEKVCIYSQKML